MSQICLIFDRRESGNDMELVGAWMQNPPDMGFLRSLSEDGRSRAYGLYFGELGHLGPLAASYFHNEPHRRVENVKTDVGNECRFTGGFFMMGHDHPAPNEHGGRPFVEFDYAMVNQDGIVVCRRNRKRA